VGASACRVFFSGNALVTTPKLRPTFLL